MCFQDAGQKGLFEHVVKLNADCFTPVSDQLIPTGLLQSLVKARTEWYVIKYLKRGIKSLEEYLHESLRKQPVIMHTYFLCLFMNVHA